MRRPRSAGLAVLLAILACPEPRDPPAPAQPAAMRRIRATGRVEGWREADVASKIPGRIVRFDPEENQVVQRGAPVVELESGDLRARVRAARAAATEAERELGRVRALRGRGVASEKALSAAEARHETRAAALDEARALLAWATIRAPFRGSLTRKLKEVGESVTTGSGPDPVFRIADLSRLKVISEVPEADIAGVRVGQGADVRPDAYPGESFPATVSRIAIVVGRKRLRSDDPRERLDEKVVEVELALAASARLKSGMTVEVAFEPARRESGR